jgi:hypothetical protein
MEDSISNIIKLSLLPVLVLAGFLYLILPRTAVGRNLKMNEAVFVLTNVIGLLCGAVGLLATFAWPHLILGAHLWELIVMPLVLIYVYWGIIMKVRKTTAILDEKQVVNMTSAAAVTWAWSILPMTVIFVLYQEQLLGGMTWFPVYVFLTLFIFSASTLYFFKRA